MGYEDRFVKHRGGEEHMIGRDYGSAPSVDF